MKYLKAWSVVFLVLLASVPTFAGRRMDAINPDLEGVVLDEEANGLDPNRNPADLSLIKQMEAYIDFAGYGTGFNPSPYNFNLVIPMGGMNLHFNALYGNQDTKLVWQQTAPTGFAGGGALGFTGAVGADSNTLVTETGVTTTTNDDWMKSTIFSGSN